MWYVDGLPLVRCLLQRGMAVLYLVAFVSARNQFPALLGENGLLPVPAFVARVPFRRAPSLFQWLYSDRLLSLVAWLGIALSALALAGLLDAAPAAVTFAAWGVLWVLYLSIVNVGQTFYAFGWESMLAEAGFFAAFLGPARWAPSWIPLFAFRWLLFRTELGAGLIKLRSDPCWRDLTCLYYHYETQPLPNPLSAAFQHFPKAVHRMGVAFSHFVQVGCPFGLFLPQPIAAICGALLISQQLILIVSGNYAWLNWLTVVLAFSAFDDRVLHALFGGHAPALAPRPLAYDAVLWALAAVTVVLSVNPVRNLLSRRQLMNYSWNPLHLVGSYGAFGSMTRERIEIVLEGSPEAEGDDWKEYGFRAKPGDPRRRPPQVAPYHLRLDWLMWFLPFGAAVRDGRIFVSGYEIWFVRFVRKLLEGDRGVSRLLRIDPFRAGAPPRRVRARAYRYTFTSAAERRASGAWWNREPLGDFLPPVALEDLPGA